LNQIKPKSKRRVKRHVKRSAAGRLAVKRGKYMSAIFTSIQSR
jgi:hypothetical protein